MKPFGFKSDLKNKALHSRNLSEDWDVERQGDLAAEEAPMGNTVNISSPPASPEATPVASTRTRGSSFVKVGGRLDFSLNRNVSEVNGQGGHSRSNSASALMSVDTSYEPLTQIPKTTTDNNNNNSTTTAAEPISPPAAATSPPATMTGRQRSASYISMTGTGLDRRASYNHTRDTSFDDYVQQRRIRKSSQGHGPAHSHKQRPSLGKGHSHSNSNSASSRSSLGSLGPRLIHHINKGSSSSLKDDVDEALSAEFGWGSGSRGSSQDSQMVGGTPPGIAVTGGSVAVATHSVHDSLWRAPSDGSEVGVLLGSVPERREEDGGGDDKYEAAGRGGAEGRSSDVDEAGRALLGDREGGAEGVMAAYTDVEVGEVGGGGRPRGMSETIEFVVTPPPRSSAEERRDMRKTWGSAYARPL